MPDRRRASRRFPPLMDPFRAPPPCYAPSNLITMMMMMMMMWCCFKHTQVVGSNMEVRCKCHGMSGSCEMKTCWKAAPEFRRVGTVLKERFDQAVLVDQSQLGNVASRSQMQVLGGRQFARRLRETDLLFYERSPNFCEERTDVDYPGITGRRCSRTGDDMDNCSSLCCGRGYNIIRQKKTERCHCRFQWCCSVVCQNCTTEQWVTVCK